MKRSVRCALLLALTGCTFQESPSRSPSSAAPAAQQGTSASPVSDANAAGSTAAARPASGSKPQSAEECQRVCNGEWAAHGLAGVVSCLCRTADAGKDCRDKKDCQGECLLLPLRSEVVEKGPPARGYFIGKCAEFVTSFGCARRIPANFQSQAPVDLSEPPPELCMD